MREVRRRREREREREDVNSKIKKERKKKKVEWKSRFVKRGASGFERRK